MENIRAAGFVNGKPCVLSYFSTARAPISSIRLNRIRAALPSLKASIPSAIDLTVVLDRTTTIRASVHDVEVALMISIGLVILVVFAFLRNVRATLIPSVAVPVSLIGTFGVMYLCNYSIDNLSLMALTISTGFVVDDAIVVIENITRYIEKGMAPMEAALHGRTRNRLHGALDQHFAGGGFYSDFVDGRHRRAVVPRICRHALGGDTCFSGDFTYDNADDVLKTS